MRKVSISAVILLTLLLSLPVSAALTHRYSFSGNVDPNDPNVLDSVGGQHGMPMNGTTVDKAIIADGQAVFDGADDYINLPGPGIDIPSYSAVTIEQWITSSTANTGFTMTFVTGMTGDPGTQYLDMQPTRNAPGAGDGCRFTITNTQWSTEAWSQSSQLNDGVEHHLVGICDGSIIQLYVDGVAMPSGSLTTQSLALLSNESCYLGRSVYTGDAWFAGSINETRIYDSVLSAPAIVLNNQLGPDTYQTCALTDMVPANKATLIPIVANLNWTADASIDSPTFEVFLETDPNLLDPNAVPVPAGSPIYSGTGTSTATATLANSKTYYWRVDTIDSGLTRYVGPRYSFTTVPPNATIVTQPQDITVTNGSTAVFTIVGTNIVSYAWYKEGNATVLSTTDTLSIPDVELADEGKYYCIVTGQTGTSPLTVQSRSVFLWTKRLIGLWKLENNMADSVATEVPGAPVHDGTFVAGTGGVETYTAGTSGQAMQFNNNAGCHVDIAATTDNDFFNFYAKGITVSFWYKGTTSAWRLPVCKLQVAGTGVIATGWLFGMNTGNGTAQLIFETKGGIATSTAVNCRDGNWHLITGLYDPVAKQIRTYVDGTNVTSGAMDLSTYEYRSNALPVNIGGRITESSVYGAVDEVRIYSYPLTADEVAGLYSDIHGPFCQTKPVYDFSGDCKETLADFVMIAAEWLECGIYPASSCD